MEGNLNLPEGSMIPGSSYGMLDLQNPIHMHHSQHPQFHHHHHQNQNQNQTNLQHQNQSSMLQFPNHIHACDQPLSLPIMDFNNNNANKGDHNKTCTSDEDEPSLTNEEECGKMKRGWHRIKWTDSMVRLLITAVSYLGEDLASDCYTGGRRKFAILQKKGKWKSISKVLAERGCYVSPQQCEDKFNDLNKRYKRLTDILGRGTSCKVVENPALLDMMDNLPDKAKEDARKILSSKHLFYEEMCSYHNGNRLNLPADPALQRSLQLALRSRDEHEHDTKRSDVHDDDHGDDVDSDDGDDHHHAEESVSIFPKRLKKGNEHEISVDINQAIPEGSKQCMKSRKIQLEEQSLHIQTEMLELKKQRFKWLRFSKKKDRELEKMRTENKRMKLENERLELELKRKELELNLN